MNQPSDSTHYDAIVIGSGIGGLAVASLLAQLQHKRVLVLERHFKLGGFTHSFSRKGYTWDVGLHYVGQMNPGSQTRQLFDLITGGAVRWNKLPPIVERFSYPGIDFGVQDDPQKYQHDLMARFPAEATAIEHYFRDVERANSWFMRYSASKLFPDLLADLVTWPGRAMALQTTQAYLDSHFRDPRLKALLVSQWGDYGVPPAQSAFAMHAVIVSHYLSGGYYPEGGAGGIAQSVQAVVEAHGGACKVNHDVTEILVEQDRACGVRVAAHGKRAPVTYSAPLIISAAGAATTYMKLLPEQIGRRQRQAIQALPSPLSAVMLFVGCKESPATLGFQGENHWLYTSMDHAEMFQRRNGILEGVPAFAYLSFGSLRDPQTQQHTAQIITWADYAAFQAWQDRPWLQRDAAYLAQKERMAQALLDLVEAQHPGFRALVDTYEVATPLTIAHFTGHAHGALYSLPATPKRFHKSPFGIQTPLRGLLMAGTDAVSLGIGGAMMGGVLAAAHVLGPAGYPQILTVARQRSV